ncbi:MAG TPA: homoserine dehydrogenase [Kofleriaceae bacterium]|nr:homoserine dehydrogenase [Kofleriaceae bacterium]
MSAAIARPSLRTARRLAVRVDALTIEGHALDGVELAGYALGPELGSAPVVIVVGGITASALPFGDAATGAEPWWPALDAPDLIDPARMTVLAPCWPGNGSTWRGFDAGSAAEARRGVIAGGAPLPPLSALGLADLVAAWLDGIGCTTPVTYVGASLGGLVGIALAARHPERVARLVTISAGLRPDGWGTATRHLQRELVRDAQRAGDVATGMARARQLGMLTYRGRDELDTRFGVLAPGLAEPPVAAYLEHHGARFAARFPVRTFLLLSEAIDRARFGVDPAEVRAALARITAEVVIVGVPGDLLFPYALQHELYRELQAVGAAASLWKLDSEFGHDAFLADQDKLAALLRDAGTFATPEPARRWHALGARPLREIRIGMIGCGTVGRGVLDLLDRQRDQLAERYGVRYRVTRLAVRDPDKPRGALADGIPRTTRALDLVGDPEVDVIVEVAGGDAVEPALRAALAAGKPVVTANKAVLARRLDALALLAQRTETPLLCEAAAAAALPIIRHLSHRADEVDALQAIVNGTCNFAITRLEQDELTLDRAIAEAQALGLAEADPSADLEGHDAAAKLSILAYRAFGAWIPPDALPVRGIGELRPADCDLAELMGFRIRLIAHAARSGDALVAAVEPVLLPDWHLLASVEEEYNAVYMKTAASGDLSLFGKGAGALPTASAVLGDLIDLAQDNSVQWPAPRRLALAAPPPRRHYVRVSAEAHPGPETEAPLRRTAGPEMEAGRLRRTAGIDRRVDSLVRRGGLVVQARAARGEPLVTHHGYLISASDDATVARLCDQLRELGRVEQTLWLGVAE